MQSRYSAREGGERGRQALPAARPRPGVSNTCRVHMLRFEAKRNIWITAFTDKVPKLAKSNFLAEKYLICTGLPAYSDTVRRWFLTVTLIQIPYWPFLYIVNILLIQWHRKIRFAYSDTFLVSQHGHCKRGGLYKQYFYTVWNGPSFL